MEANWRWRLERHKTQKNSTEEENFMETSPQLSHNMHKQWEETNEHVGDTHRGRGKEKKKKTIIKAH